MITKCKRLAITYNGEIYNFKSLKKELSQRGHYFQSGTDTEVLLLGYKEWGLDLLKKIDGMFAFGIYDADKEIVVLLQVVTI